MSSHLNEIKQLKKNILARTIQIQNLKSERKTLLEKLYEIKDRYEDNRISYEEYTHIRTTLLDGKSIDYGIEYYNEAIELYAEEIRTYKQRIHHLKESIAKQAIAFAFSIGLTLMFMSMLTTPLFPGITGFVTAEESTIVEAEIQIYQAIEVSANLEQITFNIPGSNFLGMTNINATHNYDGGSSGTTYYINYSEDSNVYAEICTKVSGPFVSESLLEIGEENMKWSNSTSTSAASPAFAARTSYTDSYVDVLDSLPAGGIDYFRFWLDIPSDAAPGNYSNTVYFQAVQNGTVCGV